MDYKELLEKYNLLLSENKRLIEEKPVGYAALIQKYHFAYWLED